MTSSPFDPICTRGRVLLVESASVFREMQCLLLERAGYAVAICDQIDAALEVASAQPIDVAVLTSDARGVEQPSFLSALRARRPNLGVIFITCAVTMDLTRELTAHGVCSVLQRPVNPSVLMRSIDEAMGITLQPGVPRMHSEAGLRNPVENPGVTAPSATPFPTGSAAPFLPPASNPPFTGHSASPFVSTVHGSGYSASPFRPQSASPFGAYAGR